MNFKRLLTIASMVIVYTTINAQQTSNKLSIYPKAGINIASLTKANDPKALIGLVVGVEGIYQIDDIIGISAGLLYSQQGVKGKDNMFLNNEETLSDATLKFDYINMPILLNVYVIKDLALKIGVQPGLLINKKMEEEGTYAWGRLINTPIDKGTNNFDFSIPLGISYEISNLIIDTRFNWGLTKTIKSTNGSNNIVFQISLGYKIPLKF